MGKDKYIIGSNVTDRVPASGNVIFGYFLFSVIDSAVVHLCQSRIVDLLKLLDTLSLDFADFAAKDELRTRKLVFASLPRKDPHKKKTHLP